MPGTTAYDGACACGGLIEATPPEVADLHALLARVLPMLVQLGDHIGNGPLDPQRADSLGVRCDLILDIKQALAGAKLAERGLAAP